MRSGIAKSLRKIVGSLERGELLPEAILDLCEEHGIDSGQISAHGLLSEVDLGIYEASTKEYPSRCTAMRSFELLHLGGTISMMGPQRVLNCHAMVAYDDQGQNRILGGQLRSARVFDVEIVIDVFDDLELERALDTETQLPLLRHFRQRPAGVEPETAGSLGDLEATAPGSLAAAREQQPGGLNRTAAPENSRDSLQQKELIAGFDNSEQVIPVSTIPSSTARADWQQAAREAQELIDRKKTRSRDEDWEDFTELELAKGDILIHPRLGECMVERVEDDTAAWIRLPKSRRLSKLALTVVKLESLGERDGIRVFKVSGGK